MSPTSKASLHSVLTLPTTLIQAGDQDPRPLTECSRVLGSKRQTPFSICLLVVVEKTG